MYSGVFLLVRLVLYSFALAATAFQFYWLLGLVFAHPLHFASVLIVFTLLMWFTKLDTRLIRKIVAIQHGWVWFFLIFLIVWFFLWIRLVSALNGGNDVEVFMRHEFNFIVAGFPMSLMGIAFRTIAGGVVSGNDFWSATALWLIYLIPALIQASVFWRIICLNFVTRGNE